MTLDIILTIPLTPGQLVVVALIIFFSIGARQMFSMGNWIVGSALLITVVALICAAFVIPVIQTAMPSIPQPWQDYLCAYTHPEMWFNITVVWP
jgi:hypothetical protein